MGNKNTNITNCFIALPSASKIDYLEHSFKKIIIFCRVPFVKAIPCQIVEKGYNSGMANENQNNQICTEEEYEKFLFIHQRFKQIVAGPKEFQGDYSYLQAELVHAVSEFWPILHQICIKDKMLSHLGEWLLDVNSLVATIYDRPIMMIGDDPFPSLRDPMKRIRAIRNLDLIMVVLNKHNQGSKKKRVPIRKRIVFKSGEVYCDGKVIRFGLEDCHEVLKNLIEHENQLILFKGLLSTQENENEAEQTLKDAITKIRNKLKPFNIQVPNVRGKGYYITTDTQ